MATTVVQNSNQAIRISGAVSATGTVASGTSTLYTCPANSYAIIQASITGTLSTAQIQIGGRVAYYFSTPNTPNNPTTGGATGPFTFYVGPSQSVVFSNNSGGGSGTMVISGVEFTNSLNGA